MRRAMIAFLGAASGLAAGCGAGGFRAVRDFTYTKPWEDCERIIVRSQNGRVELSTGSAQEVKITGRLRVHGITPGAARANLDELEVVAERTAAEPKTFLVELRVPESLRYDSAGADFLVRVPRACAAEVTTSNGAIRAVGLAGPAQLDTGNGAICVEDIAGDVRAETSNGRIVARRVGGEFRADSSNGAISADDVAGKCILETSNGAIQVAGSRGDVEARTSNGSVCVDTELPDTGSVDIETSDGSVELTLPARLTAELDLATSNGRIDAAFGDMLLKVRELSRTRLRVGVNGGGDGKVTAHTSNGSITVRFR